VGVNEAALVALRVFHAVAALIWLGGGFYYVVAVRPLAGRPDSSEFIQQAQARFQDWARPATLVMLASGAVLVFDGLSSTRAGVGYAATLAVKVAAALIAFWLVSLRRRERPRGRGELALALGMAAFVLGVVISSNWQVA
jgi:uncharacterized membrane protein